MNKELKYIRIRKTREGFTEFRSDDVLSADDYLSLLENEPSYERRLVILLVGITTLVPMEDVSDPPVHGVVNKEKLLKYKDELKALKILNNRDDKLMELVIRYNIPYIRQNKIDEILGADTNSREE